MSNYKITISIKVSGPGECFSAEYYHILRSLLCAGYEVEENNPYPAVEPENLVCQPKTMKIKLIADHLPWGG